VIVTSRLSAGLPGACARTASVSTKAAASAQDAANFEGFIRLLRALRRCYTTRTARLRVPTLCQSPTVPPAAEADRTATPPTERSCARRRRRIGACHRAGFRPAPALREVRER